MKRFIRPLTLVAAFNLLALPAAGCKDSPPPVSQVADPAAKPAEPKPAEPKPDEAKPAEPAKADEAKPAEPAADPNAKPAEPAAVNPADLTKDWQTFEDPKGGFSILAPGKPNTMPQEADTALGKVTYTNHMFTLPNDGGMLMIAWADMPLEKDKITAEVQKNMFDGGRDGMMKAVNAKLLDEKPIELAGNPGRDYLMEIPVPGHGLAHNRVRTFLVGTRHFTLQAISLASVPKEASLAFLDSLKFTGAPAAPADPAAPAPAPADPAAPAPAPAPAPQ